MIGTYQRIARGVAAVIVTSAAVFACATSRSEYEIGDQNESNPPGFSTDAGPDDTESDRDGGPGLFNDGAPPIDATSCLPDAGGPGPVGRVCLPPTDNECDGKHDVPTYPANGMGGNGFDDDCDGLVDEGCSCEAAGITKTCYLVPASQTFGGVPVGWCAENSKGTVDCVKPTTEFPGTWSGQCRGAQPPFADDVCANGDFNCDGKDQNSKASDCSCKGDPVQCPTAPLLTRPFPPASALPLEISAKGWFLNASDVSLATNWKWTLLGGDCDNILHHPTFAMFATPNGTGATAGSQVDTLGPSGNEHGLVATAPAITSSFYPAFSLSGDYLVEGEFDLNGKHYTCQQKIQVRAPGIRAELCWDTQAPSGSNVDLDLHVAQTTFANQCVNQGWSRECNNQDCYYGNCKGGSSPNWFAANPDPSVCQGWGSKTTGTCFNPRLDRDLITCQPSERNPNAPDFCGPENINIDAPRNGSKYAVGVKHFAGSPPTRAHVNVYCNGERILSTGYNPVTGNEFPKLLQSGGDSSGDFWKVGLVTATVDGSGGLSCAVDPVPSSQPHAATDGSNAYCVDNTSRNGADSAKFFTFGGAAPLDAEALCFH
ncbi:MAG: hypothetical protein KF764_22685 [Labilithrix sp.]|nr:hypothetical protein [Labilithrix sp.]